MYKAIRYIGSKQKLLNFLKVNLLYKLKENDKFYEGFAGTGIVSQYILENYNIETTGSDISLYSEILFEILNIHLIFQENELEDLLKEFFSKELIENGIIFNEFSNEGNPNTINESRNFFDAKSAIYIDSFRQFVFDKLDNGEINKRQSNLLLFFILAYTCKNANTTSMFGAYLKGKAKHIPFTLDFCHKIINETKSFKNTKLSKFINKDIINSLKEIDNQDMIYLDPPYTTRRYENNYHILNYLSNQNFNESFIKENSKGAVSDMAPNPFGKKKDTVEIFEQMITLSMEKTNLLGISYNSDGIIKQEWMEDFCLKNGYNLETKILDYKRYSSSSLKANVSDLIEILWIITK